MPRPNAPWFRTAKGTWYARLNGRTASLGVRGKENKKAAYEAWHRLMSGAPVVHPTPPTSRAPTGGTTPSAGPTVKDLADRFLADARARLRPSTMEWYERTLAGLSAAFGARPAASLPPEEIEGWLRGTGWGHTTRSHAVGILRVAYSWAGRRRLISDDPTRFLTKPPKRSRGAEAVLSSEDHAKLMAAASPAFRDLLAVLHATGARPCETAAITAENFHPDAGVVTLDRHKTDRTGKRRVIYLTPAAVELLARLKARYGSGLLLRNSAGRPWTKNTIVLAMRRLRAKTGVKATAYHYRHTAATDLLAAGVSDAQVAELLGHSGTAMLAKHYSHLGTRARVLREALTTAR